MAIGKISGVMLKNSLDRQGVNLQIDGNLAQFDVTNRRVGINTTSPQYSLDVNGNAQLGNIVVYNNTITSTTGKIALGSISNVTLTGGSAGSIIYTDGSGNLGYTTLAVLSALQGFTGNNITLGTSQYINSGGNIGTSALTTGLTVSDAINLLDAILSNITNVSGNVVTTGNLYLNGVPGYGTINNVLITDGTGATSFVNANTIPAVVSINANTSAINANLTAVNVAIAAINANVTNVEGNTIVLGANTVASLSSNAVTLTQTTKVTDAIAQLNYVLGKLVPPSPPNFPNSTSLTLTSGTTGGLMCTNFTQVDNTGTHGQLTAGTLFSAVRANTYATTGPTNVGPGSSGTVTVYLNGLPAGALTLNATATGNYTNSNLAITNVEDYHAVVSSVTAGFWSVFTAAASGSNIPQGWNNVYITDSATAGNTGALTWYNDVSATNAGTPTFTATSIVLSSNVVQYSSTIPMLTTGAGFTLTGNVNNLSGETYPNNGGLLIYNSVGGGAIAAAGQVSYSSAGIATPLYRYSYASSVGNVGNVKFTTTANITSGFGSSSAGPTLYVNNNYNVGSATYSPGATVLYKTGTSNAIEETSIPVTTTKGTTTGVRIVNPGSGDNPTYTGSEAAFNSQTGPFYTYDATNVASKIQFDQTNYSSGYLPVGPNLSGQGSSQYFTFKFTQATLQNFNISYTGTIAGLWVALPGSTIDTTAAPTNGWLNMAQAYAGSGVPGTGSGGNGSTGCSTGGAATLNSNGTYSVTFTPGTAASVGSVYVRIKLTSGQSLTALSIVTNTH